MRVASSRLRDLAGLCRASHSFWLKPDATAPIGVNAASMSFEAVAVPRRKREYPEAPLVGVGVVVFRSTQSQEVLVVRRAKEPSKGMWSFPGGGLELGETIRSCAVREVQEETGVRLRNDDDRGAAECFSQGLAFPTAFAASDSITTDEQGRIMYQYAIIEVAALADNPNDTLVPSDDVDGAMWMPVDELRGLADLTPNCARFAEEALGRFMPHS